MSRQMTCWKEIAHYLGKGVRTVQRWEQMGLPIRRPHGRPKGRVLAFSDEIDAWMHTEFEGGHRSELEALREEIAKLEEENKLLRGQLRHSEPTSSFVQLNGFADMADWNEVQKRYFLVIQRNNSVLQQLTLAIDKARHLQELITRRRGTRNAPDKSETGGQRSKPSLKSWRAY